MLVHITMAQTLNDRMGASMTVWGEWSETWAGTPGLSQTTTMIVGGPEEMMRVHDAAAGVAHLARRYIKDSRSKGLGRRSKHGTVSSEQFRWGTLGKRRGALHSRNQRKGAPERAADSAGRVGVGLTLRRPWVHRHARKP